MSKEGGDTMLNVMYAVHEMDKNGKGFHTEYRHIYCDEVKFLGCDKDDYVKCIRTEKNDNVEVKTTTTIQIWQLDKIMEY